ncbi:hypothetical protein [Actinacidiphila glaucinigra]|uniref:hypothetical protein n=1 Tax=Actinacidiphila glaucinigra TaxID=235986 RepID=UPI00370D628E
MLLSFVLTPGRAGDCPLPGRAGQVPHPRTCRPPPHPTERRGADKAYSSRANRAYLRRRHISGVIPEKTDQQVNRKKKKGSAGGRLVTYDPERYKQRNTVECCFQKILATRYDKTPRASRPDSTSEDRSCG